MITLTMTINRHTDVVKVSAVRVKPTHRAPEHSELCDYSIKVNGEELPYTISCEYGSAVKLGIKMLEQVEETV